MTGFDSFNDEEIFEVSIAAKSRNDVLTAVGSLSEEVREALGDESFKDADDATVETFTAASFEAARDYVTAADLSYKGDHAQSVEYYRAATEKDPNFGRAYASWALSAYKLGNKDEADELWKKALTLMNTMTERERLRTLGIYYAVVTRNYTKAKETFTELVDKYPSDAAARNNLLVVAFLSLDLQQAYEQSASLLKLYPNSALYRSNYALIATYAGDFEDADKAAKALVADDPDYAVSYLAIAAAAMWREDYAAARDAYTRMESAKKSEYDSAMGTFGLADVELYLGNFAKARELAAAGIEEDFAAGKATTGSSKLMLVAESHIGEGNKEEAVAATRRLFSNATLLSHKVVAARVALAADELDLAEEIGEALGKELQPQSRAYGLMVEGVLLRKKGEFVAAIDRFNEAIAMADLWVIRFELGRAYLDGGFFAEAIDEFHACSTDRVGEVTAVFLDDIPTYRYLAEVSYWQGRAEEALGMTDAARENYIKYVATRPDGGPYVDDARARVGAPQ